MPSREWLAEDIYIPRVDALLEAWFKIPNLFLNVEILDKEFSVGIISGLIHEFYRSKLDGSIELFIFSNRWTWDLADCQFPGL